MLEVTKRPVAVRPKTPEELVLGPTEGMVIGQKLDAVLNGVLALKQTMDAELEILRHNQTIPEDFDASDGTVYSLADGYAATTTLTVPTGHIFLFKGFFSSDVLGTTYATYIDDRLYVTIPDLVFPAELGVPVRDEAKIVVTNASGGAQTYVTYMKGIFRPRELWERRIRRMW